MREPSEILVENLPLIDRLVVHLGMRYRMSPADVEEFSAEVRLRLVENDYAVIRAFRARSSFATYLAAVFRRLLLDYRAHHWGKWHVSAEAQRLGPAAMDLERFLHRDEMALDEAINAMLTKYDLTREEVEAMAARLPPRSRRKIVPLEEALEVPAHNSFAPERTSVASEVSKVVTSMLARLPEEDQLVLRLRFDSEMTVSQIARALHKDQQLLYRRLHRIYEELRKELQTSGVRSEDVNALIGNDDLHLSFGLRSSVVTPTLASDTEEPVEANRPNRDTHLAGYDA